MEGKKCEKTGKWEDTCPQKRDGRRRGERLLAFLLALLTGLGLISVPQPVQALGEQLVLSVRLNRELADFYVDIYDEVHGPVSMLNLDGNTAFCLDYGLHSPRGTLYHAINIQEKLSESQRERIAQGLMFALYLENTVERGIPWGDPDIQDLNLEGRAYLLVQVWMWAAMQNRSIPECVQSVETAFASLGGEHAAWAEQMLPMAQDFLDRGWEHRYTLQMAAYASDDPDNQDLFTYDFTTLQPAPDELAVGVKKTGSVSGMSYAGAVYGVYGDASCTDLRASIETGAEGSGTVVFTGREGTYYLREITAPEGTVKNDTVYPVQLTYGAVESVPVIEAENQEWYGRVSLTKRGPEGELLDGAVFALEEWDGSQYRFRENLHGDGRGVYSSSQLFYSPVNQGKFRVYEVSAPENYESQGWSQEFVLTQNEQRFSYSVTNTSWQGSVQVKKTDQETGNGLEGAVFALDEWNGTGYVYREELQDAGDGIYQAQVAYRPENQGKFRIREVQAPENYQNSGWSQEFVLAENRQEFTYTVANEPVKGRIRVYKEDAETGTVAQGDAVLDGAVYGLFAREDIWLPDGSQVLWQAGAEVARGTIEKGTLEWGSLYMGSYYVKELEAPEGYVLSAEEQTVELSCPGQEAGEVVLEVTVQEQVKKRPVRLLKVESGGASGQMDPLAGAEFTFKRTSQVEALGWEEAPVYAQVATDSHGAAETEPLPYGSYLVRETVVPEEHSPLADFTVEIREHAPEEPVEIILNNTPFQAYIRIVKVDAETGETIPLAGATFGIWDAEGNPLRQNVGGAWVDTFTTDETGTVTTPQLTMYGTYTLRELQAPAGYLAETEEISFSVTGSQAETAEDGLPVILVRVENTPIQVEIAKTDLTDGKPVPGAHLQIRDASGQVLYQWVTGEEPYRISAIPAGEYMLEETLPPREDGYVQSEAVPFTVEETGEIQRVTMTNDHTRVQVCKTDAETGEPLAGASLEIRDAEGNVVHSWVSGEEPELVEYLPVGTYTLAETQAPEGYLPAEPVAFTVEETGEIQTVTLANDYTRVKIRKMDEATGEPLAGASLEIRDAEGNVVHSWVSGEEAELVKYLPAGTYTLVETQAPEGYVLAEAVPFTVEATGEMQEVTMGNRLRGKITGEVPPGDGTVTVQTGDTESPVMWLAFLLAAGGLAAVLGIRRSRHEKK